jgi:alpha-1,3-mannosyltransferase
MGFLKHRVPDLKLYIVGAEWGGIRKELEVLIREMGLGENVVFAGEAKTREEVLKYFARSKYLVSASEYEGFGISVLEAMAAGLVVIVNDIDAFRNFVVDGKNGFLVNYFDPEEASTEILEIMNKDSSSIRENAKKTAASYGWGEIVKKIEGVYEEAIRTTE